MWTLNGKEIWKLRVKNLIACIKCKNLLAPLTFTTHWSCISFYTIQTGSFNNVAQMLQAVVGTWYWTFFTVIPGFWATWYKNLYRKVCILSFIYLHISLRVRGWKSLLFCSVTCFSVVGMKGPFSCIVTFFWSFNSMNL